MRMVKLWIWETSPLLQDFVITAGLLTGLTVDGSGIPYDDLIPLKARSSSKPRAISR